MTKPGKIWVKIQIKSLVRCFHKKIKAVKEQYSHYFKRQISLLPPAWTVRVLKAIISLPVAFEHLIAFAIRLEGLIPT